MPRAPRFVDGDEGEGGVGYLLAAMSPKPLRPGLDVNLDRGPPDGVKRGVDTENVADLDRANEGHRLDGDGDDPAGGGEDLDAF